MQGDQRKHQAFEVLHEVVKDSEALWVAAFLHIQQGTDLGSLQRQGREHYASLCTSRRVTSPSYRKGDVFFVHLNLQLLSAIFVGLGPVVIIFLGNLAFANDSLNFADNDGAQFN
jgi:hypothetical protein